MFARRRRHHGAVGRIDGLALGEDPNRKPLRRYIDNDDHFVVLFKDMAFAYIDGNLYRDDQLADGGGNLMRHIQVDRHLARPVSEKGEFAPGKEAFDEDSVFGAVAMSIANGDDVLICDDLGDEWADFIGLNTHGSPNTISFYHAKHGPLSLGASPFRISVAVSQAIKNLGRMSLQPEEMARKMGSWSTVYVNGGQQTAITRIVRGDPAALDQIITTVRTAPDAVRRVYIVTSSLSRSQVGETLRMAKEEGVAPAPHFVQLYWLLLSFFQLAPKLARLAISFVRTERHRCSAAKDRTTGTSRPRLGPAFLVRLELRQPLSECSLPLIENLRDQL
jgi:hypothetical protein